ncbi:uncharacterized protein LOC120336949 isoform X1 [Styela clava]
MEPSSSTQDLDRAIQELDGMYHDLKRRSLAEAQLNLPDLRNFNEDEEDYDIPRPAGGFLNTPVNHDSRPPTFSTFGTFRSPYDDDIPIISPIQVKVPNSREFVAKSSTFSSGSEYSSGFGTLPHPSERAQISMIEIDFPGPPAFEPPVPPSKPNPKSSSDSDYDEVASNSDSSENVGHQQPTTKKDDPGEGAAVYTQVRRPDHFSFRKLDDDDYDEVYVPPTQRDSAVRQEFTRDDNGPSIPRTTVFEDEIETLNQPSNTSPKSDTAPSHLPAVVQMKEIDNKSVDRNNSLQKENKVEEHSFITPCVQVEPAKSWDYIAKDSPKDVIDASRPVDENGNVVDSSRLDTEPSHTAKAIEVDGTPYSPQSYNSTMGGSMDAEAQRKSISKREDCPCECRFAVPLMSAAVILCVIALMLMVIGYVYVGLQNDKYLESAKDEIDNGLNIGGSGNGTT